MSASSAHAGATAGNGPDWSQLPIFPLSTVLFPGGLLPLRVFEARYIDMTRECMKRGTPFGVCLIKEGVEVGSPALPHAIGCLAEIRDWDMQQLGVLHIKTVGTRRFRIETMQAKPDGLVQATAQPLDADPSVMVGPEFVACGAILQSILPKLPVGVIAEPYNFSDASWLSNRLAEVLPIPPVAKQRLMELEDAEMRLEIIQRFLEQQGLK